MKSFVLYHKNGVITEERFQKLSLVQWLFHFHEIVKWKSKEKDTETNSFKSLIDRVDLVIAAINPDLGGKLFELKENPDSVNLDKPVVSEDISEDDLSLLTSLPELMGTYEGASKFVTSKKYNRKLGIFVD